MSDGGGLGRNCDGRAKANGLTRTNAQPTVIAVGTGGTIIRTTDGGVTWTPQTSGTTAWLLGVSFSDRSAGTTVGSGGTILRTTDGGATWTPGNATWPVDPHWVLDASIVPNPATAGDLWMAFAPNSNQPWTYPLLHSTDGGKTFAVVTTIASANYVALGKGLNQATPALYIHGQVPGATADAIYQSLDLGATWTEISDPARMQFGEINDLEADMRVQDMVYVGSQGRGILYGFGPASGIK